MFKITPLQNEYEQQRYAEACGTVLRKGTMAYGMFDVESERIMGFAQFEICGKTARITDIKEAIGSDDFEAMFILGRQTLNFIDGCGAHTITASMDCGDARLLSSIGFTIHDGSLCCNTSGMFDGNCSGHTVTL